MGFPSGGIRHTTDEGFDRTILDENIIENNSKPTTLCATNIPMEGLPVHQIGEGEDILDTPHNRSTCSSVSVFFKKGGLNQKAKKILFPLFFSDWTVDTATRLSHAE